MLAAQCHDRYGKIATEKYCVYISLARNFRLFSAINRQRVGYRQREFTRVPTIPVANYTVLVCLYEKDC